MAQRERAKRAAAAKNKVTKTAKPNHTGQYIAKAPKVLQRKLREFRAAIRAAAPGATERTDYFAWPGYSYPGGYDYDGMFAWFSYKGADARLHLRPPVIQNHKGELAKFATT